MTKKKNTTPDYSHLDIENFNDLDSALVLEEGGKSQIKMGDGKEFRKKIFNFIKTNEGARKLLFRHLSK